MKNGKRERERCTVSSMESSQQEVGEVLSFVGSCYELVNIALGICLSRVTIGSFLIRIRGLPIKENIVFFPVQGKQ